MTASEILQGVRDRLSNPESWNKDAQGIADVLSGKESEEGWKAMAFLVDCLPFPFWDVETWEKDPYTSHPELMHVLDKAIRFAGIYEEQRAYFREQLNRTERAVTVVIPAKTKPTPKWTERYPATWKVIQISFFLLSLAFCARALMGCTSSYTHPIEGNIAHGLAAPPGVMTWWVDPNLPIPLQVAFQEAVSDWQLATANVWTHTRSFTWEGKPSELPVKVVLWTENFPHDPVDERVLAWTSAVGGSVIQIPEWAYSDGDDLYKWRLVFRHEIGHVLGANHIDGTVMHPSINPVFDRCIQKPVLDAVAKFNSIDSKLFVEVCP